MPSNSEGSGAVSGNSSSNGLLHESSEHLSHSPLASQEDVAKIAIFFQMYFIPNA
jgi:hypothetical protein